MIKKLLLAQLDISEITANNVKVHFKIGDKIEYETLSKMYKSIYQKVQPMQISLREMVTISSRHFI